MKKYIIIAGVNGAGKSTLYQTIESLKGIPRVNVDEIVREIGNWQNFSDVFKAGKIAVKRISQYFDAGIFFLLLLRRVNDVLLCSFQERF